MPVSSFFVVVAPSVKRSVIICKCGLNWADLQLLDAGFILFSQVRCAKRIDIRRTPAVKHIIYALIRNLDGGQSGLTQRISATNMLSTSETAQAQSAYACDTSFGCISAGSEVDYCSRLTTYFILLTSSKNLQVPS
ncbi:MAG: hypothetical protein EZS28_048617 [Streblomastix strix]|uniref:Uncharacterized protein n=1 Tax=Streblomastix strix TaxID=222440 RepID=A0A5J4TC81_9EUKA|nr:MAG: hypothetical protein EZS28_048617 [Streblomastix strix]